ncbi:MAG: NAD-dependent epimerase/dehydratase family protein, partial [Patescibacteria group bacterium]
MKYKRVLITGGEGFLGSYLVTYLLQTGGYEIVIFDTL